MWTSRHFMMDLRCVFCGLIAVYDCLNACHCLMSLMSDCLCIRGYCFVSTYYTHLKQYIGITFLFQSKFSVVILQLSMQMLYT